MDDTTFSRERLPSVSRRGYLAGLGGIAACLGGGGVLLSRGETDEEPRYLLQQGYLRWQVDPVVQSERTVEEFYGYSDGTANLRTDLTKLDAASRLFIYEGPVDSSLVFLHGSPDASNGGRAKFSMSGLSRSKGDWAVRDDPTGTDDDFEPWEGGNQKVDWEWGPGDTDGGAYWGVLDRSDYTIKVNPKELSGVDSWRFITGDADDPEYVDLSTAKPAKLRPMKEQWEVKRANIDIMPDAEEAEFDPYSSDSINVTVKQPPEGADDDEWVTPEELDPGNYTMNFGSREYLAGQNAAQPQKSIRHNGQLHLKYKISAANFSLESAYGYLVARIGGNGNTFVRGRDEVKPGGYDNTETSQGGLVVSAVSPGTDGELNDEYVEFTNRGSRELSLSGYTVSDEAGWEFHFPDGFTLASGQSVTLYTGEGEYGPTELYWGVESGVWDEEDTVTVTDDEGIRVVTYGYPRT